MHILITGHTGFKGTWLAFLLTELGHEVSGISLEPLESSLYSHTFGSKLFKQEFFSDIRDYSEVKRVLSKVQPDRVVHLAAQPLVGESYLEPFLTHTTNFNGTLNVLAALSDLKMRSPCLIITTDKVYKPSTNTYRNLEESPLGGDDPYSASKAAADLLCQSWQKSFTEFPIAICRAGNVIGGGDYATDRLVPDLVRSIVEDRSVEIRNPESIRPWQHVLDCLNGYTRILLDPEEQNFTGAWNFGPSIDNERNVLDLTTHFLGYWGSDIKILVSEEKRFHEMDFLRLDSTKANMNLRWNQKYSFEKTVEVTCDWYKALENGSRMEDFTRAQVRDFINFKQQ